MDPTLTINIVGLAVGLMMIAVLLAKRQHLENHVFLLWLLLSLCILLASNVLAGAYYWQFPRPFLLADTLILVIGPATFLFVRSFLFPGSPQKVWTHFAYPLLYFGFRVVMVAQPTEDIIHLLEGNTTFNEVVAPMLLFIMTLQTAAYLVATCLLFWGQGQQGNQYSEQPFLLPRLLTLFLALLSTFCLLHFLPYLGLSNPLAFISVDMVWLAIVGLIFVLNGYFLVYSDSRGLLRKKTPFAPPKNINQLSVALEDLLKNKALLTDQGLTQSLVAEKLEVTRTTVSMVINNHFKKSFYNYINEKRIDEFVRVVTSEAYPHLTYYGVAQEVGFNSKATFYKAFKAKYNMTPREYFNRS